MKFLPLVWRNLTRRKIRTIFTVLSIFVAFILFGVLMAIRAAFTLGVELAGQDRLMVIDKISLIQPLPLSYMGRIAQVEGVKDISHANWFGGYYQDVRNQFATMAVDPSMPMTYRPVIGRYSGLSVRSSSRTRHHCQVMTARNAA